MQDIASHFRDEPGLQRAPTAPAAPAIMRDAGDTIATASPLRLGVPVTDTLIVAPAAAHADADVYAFSFEAGIPYEITMEAARVDGPALADPYLTIVDRQGNVVAENDDDGASLNSRITVTFDTSETYYIVPGSYETRDSGGYRLSISAGTRSDPTRAIDWGTEVDGPGVSVYFAAEGERFDGILNTAAWTAYERAQVFEALGEYSNIANLTFTEAGSAAGADFILTHSPNLTGLGLFNPPGTRGEGVGWFSTRSAYWSDEAGGLLEPGSYTYLTFLHEFGHGLGLAHPHDRGGGSTIIPTTYDDNGLDQGIYTVMSYNDAWWDGPLGTSSDFRYGYSLTPAALDIAVIQEKYGANTGYHAGDDVYSVPMSNAPGTGYLTIWDAGGIDTIAADGGRDAIIDLRAATLSGSAEHGAGGYLSYANGVYGGITIANGVVIENASGGAGDDAIAGNGAANHLSGGEGRDTLTGGAGKDTLDGGAGNDRMSGGAGHDVYIVDSAGDQVIEARAGGLDTVKSETLDLDIADYANVEALALMGEADLTATGDDGANFITGNAGGNTIRGGGGRDNLRSGRGDDAVYGEDGNDIILAQDGDDLLFGNTGRDNLRGGEGDDTMSGGTGADRFIIGPDQGDDVITDLELGRDKVQLSGLELAGFGALSAMMADTADGVLITFDPAASLLLSGFIADDLSAREFIF
ncbi:hypothetical protein ATO13_16089 [Stappia sp. 22II-S9-Z10]|nr:hypothetical protein ATO13_16089 [Stappia sp. 22II-S9-Z10]